MMYRGVFTAALALSCGAVSALVACGGGDSVSGGPDAAAPDGSTADVAAQQPDASTTVPDASPPAPPVDAGPRTEEVRSVGIIRVANDAVLGAFSEDDTVIRYAEAPDYVLVIRSSSKPYSQVGTITVAGQVVGVPGGPDGGIDVEYKDDNLTHYRRIGILVYPPTDEFTVDVSQGPFTPAFPALLPQTLRPSLPVVTTVTSPTKTGSAVAIPTDKPWTITWTAPAGQLADQNLIVDLQIVPSGAEGARAPQLICNAPLAKGTFTIPAGVLQEAKAVSLPLSPEAYGNLGLLAGGQKIVDVKNATYIVRAATEKSTTFGPFEGVRLD